MSRTKNVVRNVRVALIGQVLGLIISFIARKVFVMFLSAEYLGVSGLFANILSILSLAELGVGSAIVYSLYKPLADGDEEKVKSIMRLYKKLYTTIGIFVLVAGMALAPFLHFFINEPPNIPENLYLIYFLYVINSGVSYFFTYKRSLIIADQRRDIATAYRYGLFSLMNVAQIVVLFMTHNFYLYLFVMVGNTLLENILISIKADKMYPCLKEKNVQKLERTETTEIKKNTFAMMCHKIGGVIVNGTDNLLISKFVGIIEVGLYSNYALVTSALKTVFGLLFNSISASFGNLNAKEGREKNIEIFDTINFITFWLIGFCSVMLITFFNPFISIWLGEKYCCSMFVVVIIVFNFFLSGTRQAVLMAKSALGLFWQDRYMSLIEAGVNLIISIILGEKIGMVGIFMGTAISWITVSIWYETLVLYRDGFKISVWRYFRDYAIYFGQIVVNVTIIYNISTFVSMENFSDLIVAVFICTVVSNVIFIIMNLKNKQLKECFNLARKILCKNEFI